MSGRRERVVALVPAAGSMGPDATAEAHHGLAGVPASGGRSNAGRGGR